MTNSFGRRLRAARRSVGLTQVALGGSKLSGSYVSLVESGLREPTPEMIEHFAAVLDMEPSEVASWSRADSEAVAELASIHAVLASREFDAVEELAAAASHQALATGDFTLFWELSVLRMDAARRRRDFTSCRDIARELLEVDSVTSSTRLHSWTLSQLSAGLRETGQLDEAISTAKEALRLAKESASAADHTLGVASREINLAARAYSAAITEAGVENEMESLCSVLQSQIASAGDNDHQELSELRWTLGNVYFALERPEEGVQQHDMALDSMRTHRISLDERYRLLRNTVTARLEAGVLTPRTEELTFQFHQVTRWVEGENSFSADFTAALWLVKSGEPSAAQEPLRRLMRHRGEIRPGQRARANELCAHHLEELEPLERVQMLAEAADLYVESGDDAGMRRALSAATGVQSETVDS